MKRTFKAYSITSGGTPQPLIGTLTTAALSPYLPSFNTPAPQSIPVSDSSMFRRGDYFWLDVGSNAERIAVTAVADSTHISGTVTKAHASGVTVALDAPMTALYVQTLPGNSAAVVIFYADQMYTAARVAPNLTGLIQAVAQLEPVTAPTQPVEFSSANNFGANPDSTGYYWCDGTSSDSYLPSIDIS